MGVLATIDSLNTLTDFNQPFRVKPFEPIDNTAELFFPDISIPEYIELYRENEDEDWQIDENAIRGWKTFSDGASSQYGYDGPILHDSEFLGGGLAKKIINTPGTYVLVEALYEDPEAEDGYDRSGWTILKKEEK